MRRFDHFRFRHGDGLFLQLLHVHGVQVPDVHGGRGVFSHPLRVGDRVRGDKLPDLGWNYH